MQDYSLSNLVQLLLRPEHGSKRRYISKTSILVAAQLIEMIEYKCISIERVPDKNPPRWLPLREQTMFDQGIISVNESISPKLTHKEAYEFIRTQKKPHLIGWYLLRLPAQGTNQRALDDGLMHSHRRGLFYQTTLTEKGTSIVHEAKSDIDAYLENDAADISKLSNQSRLIVALLVKSYIWDKVYRELYKGKTKSQKIALQQKIELAVSEARITNDTSDSLELILNALSLTNAESSTP